MNVRSVRDGRVLVLRFEGGTELDAATAPAVKAEALGYVSGEDDVVLDLGRVEFMDSSGISVLISLVKRARMNGGRILIAGATSHVSEVFEIIRLDEILDLRPDVASAVRYLAESASG